MITGAHLILNSPDPELDRAFLRDVIGWPSVGAAGPDDPWLIFAVPPAELGVHPTEGESSVGLFLTCDDLPSTMAELSGRGAVFVGEPTEQGWGTLTQIRLPSGATVGLYEPRHATAHD